jgi:GntR family transcriptional regulator
MAAIAPGKTSHPGLAGLRLDRGSPLPLHAQAEQLLRRLLERPEYGAGGLLPDEVSLAVALGISRNTLRAAIGRLVQGGRLERKAGVGTRVVEPKVHSGVGAWHSFTREMEAKGIKVETYTVKASLLSVPAEVARPLQIARGDKVLCLDRVRGWDDRPEVYFRSYFHPRLALTGKDDFSQPLYELIRQRCSIVADQSLEELTAVAADQRLARLLAVRVGAPLLRRDRTVLDTARRPMEFAVVHYRCDRFKLTLQLRQE